MYALGILCILALIYYRVWFLRMPDREVPMDNTEFVSPANGDVVSVQPWNSDSFVETKGDWGAISVWAADVDTAGIMVSIQMNVYHVHYQRMPVAGKVISTNRVPGAFKNAVKMHNEFGTRFENEHNDMLFEAEDGYRFKIIQIAGFVARRIVDFLEPGQELEQGEVIGLIKLGSQVTVLLPAGMEVLVKPGDKVIDGETVLARVPSTFGAAPAAP